MSYVILSLLNSIIKSIKNHLNNTINSLERYVTMPIEKKIQFVHNATEDGYNAPTVHQKNAPQIGDIKEVVPPGFWRYFSPPFAAPYLMKANRPLNEPLTFEKGSPYDVIMKDLAYWLSPECDKVKFPSRSYILHGPPGTGKSTIGYAIGNALAEKVPVFFYAQGYEVNINSVRALQNFGVKSALLIMDECDRCDDLSGVLDYARTAGFMVIMTTNNFDELDENVRVRPGRCDRKFEVSKPPRATLIKAAIARGLTQTQADYLADKYESIPLAVLNELAFRLCMKAGTFEALVTEVVSENQFDVRENVDGTPKKKRFGKS